MALILLRSPPSTLNNRTSSLMKSKSIASAPLNHTIGPLLGYICVSVIATWPVVTHIRGWVPGVGDWGQNMWALWWSRQSLLTLAQFPFHTTYLFYPSGVTLLFHPLDLADGLLTLPLYGLLGGDVSYNLIILLSFVLSGWGAYLLALYLTHNRLAAFVAGLVYTFSPYHFLRVELGHLNLSTIQWIPFYLLFLLKFLQTGSKRAGLLAVFFLVFIALSSWYYVIYLGLTSLALVFWPGRLPRGAGQRQNGPDDFRLSSLPVKAGRVVAVLALAVVLLLPLLFPMVQLMRTTTFSGAHDPLRHSVDLLSFWVPGPPSTWAGWFEEIWISYAAQNREPGASAYLGYSTLVVGLIGLAAGRWRYQALWWLTVAVGFSVLALGPVLQIDGKLTGITLPYQWLENIAPILSLTGIPGRFVVMTSLALAMLAAYGLDSIFYWGQQRRKWPVAWDTTRLSRPLIITLIVGLLVIGEYSAAPVRITSTSLPDFYAVAAKEEPYYTILDIKWDANYLLHAQTVHGKPLIGGWLARLPESQAVYLDQGSFDKVFLHLLLGPDGVDSVDQSNVNQAIQAELAAREVRYVVDHDNLAAPWLRQFLDWPVVFTADGIVVYQRPD
jgi:hypothetical protein